MNSKINIYLILWAISGLLSCENYKIEEKPNAILFPAGRSFLGTSEIMVTLDGSEISPEIIYDSCGSYWIKIPGTDIHEKATFKIRFTRMKDALNLFHEDNMDEQDWLEHSIYIDSENEILRSKAEELTQGIESTIDKAKSIHQFVTRHITLKVYNNSFLDKASVTYDLGYGTCMNFSRLYVALCRAAGIPARTIWGMVYGHNDDHIYDYHHQWAEMQDDSGYWHPADFNYTTNFDLNDIRYLDLIYAAEENILIKNRGMDMIVMEGIIYFNNYPATLTGRLGFQLIEDDRPNSMTVEYTYEF